MGEREGEEEVPATRNKFRFPGARVHQKEGKGKLRYAQKVTANISLTFLRLYVLTKTIFG